MSLLQGELSLPGGLSSGFCDLLREFGAFELLLEIGECLLLRSAQGNVAGLLGGGADLLLEFGAVELGFQVGHGFLQLGAVDREFGLGFSEVVELFL